MSVLDRFRLDGKRALVTGASRGLGREIALALADVGADIVLVARPSDALDESAAAITALGRTVTTFPADISDPDIAAETCERVLATGPIDILVNNVGGRRENVPIEAQTLDSWRAMMDLNLTAAVTCTRMIGKAMIDAGRGGRVINIASSNASRVGRGIGGRHYEAAKAAIVQFTRAAAVDWAPHGITVNAICPGLFMTAPNQRWAREKPEIIEAAVGNIPMGHAGDPKDIGPLAVYLASDASCFMTGASLAIDGGTTC
ncbi:SDR family oxidoreductase [Acuticoccus sp. M5D2P5]|uniref:SDR family NAD(P)-dependent oxidoreductase n=1 Tax=Acuticoccus kalidii TaxID=2910977 RepID=UPI001F3653BF|nr:SDR family oxidoreductase [Acuticoccus kalidii]